jgi:hypothetical protein
MKPYYILATRDSNRWSVQFGDFDKSVVDDEATDYIEGSAGYKKADVKVLKVVSAMPAATENAIAELNRALPYTTPRDYNALASYAAEHGRKWKEALSLDWYHARAIGERGAILHALRNHPRFGCEGLEKFRL